MISTLNHQVALCSTPFSQPGMPRGERGKIRCRETRTLTTEPALDVERVVDTAFRNAEAFFSSPEGVEG